MSKIGDVALIRLKERADVLTHRADPSSNGMTPIDIPDMSTFRQFAGKYLIIDKSQPAQVVFYGYAYLQIHINRRIQIFLGKSCTVSGWGRQVSGASTKPDTLNRVCKNER